MLSARAGGLADRVKALDLTHGTVGVVPCRHAPAESCGRDPVTDERTIMESDQLHCHTPKCRRERPAVLRVSVTLVRLSSIGAKNIDNSPEWVISQCGRAGQSGVGTPVSARVSREPHAALSAA